MKFAHFFITSLLVVITLFSTPSKADWQDLQSGFEIVESTPHTDRYTRSYYVDVEIENSGLSVLDGPLRLVIDDASLVIIDSDGFTDSGAPYLNLSFDRMAPGERHQMRINFELGRVRLVFELRLQAGINAAAPNLSPIANANVDKAANEETTIILQGTGTNTDGQISAYKWKQTSGPVIVLVNPSDATARFLAPKAITPITMIFELTVTDDKGAKDTDSATITVLPVNENPVADAGADKSVNEQTFFMLAGSDTDPDSSVASYRWTQSAEPSVTLSNPNNASTSFDSPASTSALTLIFQLTVTDDEGATTADGVVITVNPLPTQTLTVTGENDGNNFMVPWNDVGADSYRVLFWDNDGNVYEPTTASLSLSIASAIRRLSGSLVVEAYDARGNSVFSSPINVEAL
jgi:hypothetical protein